MKSKSLKKQLAVSLIVSLIFLCVLSNTIVYSYIKSFEMQAFDEALAKRIRALAAVTTVGSDGSMEVDLNEFELRDFLPSPDASYYAVRSAEKRVLVRSPSLGKENIPILSDEPDVVSIKNVVLPDGRSGRAASILFSPANSDGNEGGEANRADSESRVYLTVAMSRERLDYLSRIELSFALLVGLLLILGAVCIVWITVERSFRKFRKFSDQVNTIHYDNLSERLIGDGLPVEMIPFKVQFNRLMARLEAGSAREKRYIANVSHELRTPIAELRLLHEVALLEAKRNGNHHPSSDYFEDSLELAKKLGHLVETIAALNRCESGRQKVDLKAFDLGETIVHVWSRWKERADARQMRCAVEVVKPSRIVSDKDLVEAVLANLFSNAVAYANSATDFTCHLTEGDSGFRLELTNATGELEAGDLDHLAEPFWQKDASRSDPSHAGLGWSLIASYCRTLHIDWTVDMPVAGLFRVRLSFPATANLEGQREGSKGEHAKSRA